jgi:outer membrane murein-binding lipoprotein Lpp
MRTWMRLVLAVLLATPFTSALVRADSSDQLKPPSTDQKLDKLQKDVDTLRSEINALQTKVLALAVRQDTPAAELREILRRLDNLALKLEAGIRQPTTRESGAGPGPLPAGPGNGAPASTGTITLRNQYSAVATVHINGRSFVIEPNRTATLSVPLGTFNYEVEVDGYGMVQPLRSETLRPNGHIITIFPRVGG